MVDFCSEIGTNRKRVSQQMINGISLVGPLLHLTFGDTHAIPSLVKECHLINDPVLC